MDAGPGGLARVGNDGDTTTRKPVPASGPERDALQAAFATQTSKFGIACRALDRCSRYIATAPLDQPVEPEMTITIEYCTV
jgi:hypothetical protein